MLLPVTSNYRKKQFVDEERNLIGKANLDGIVTAADK